MKSHFILSAVVLLFSSVGGFAWGPEGHAAIGWIAEHNLTPEAKEAVDKILLGKSMADPRVASWADMIRSQNKFKKLYPQNDKWHYVDIDVATPESEFVTPKNGNEVIDQVVFWRGALTNREATAIEQRNALRFLVHFIGDLHQPLHCASRDKDRGGNHVPIHSFSGNSFTFDADDILEQSPNLHKVWDEYLIFEAMNGASLEDFSRNLATNVQAGVAEAWQQGDPKSWAWDAHMQAVTNAYVFSDGTPLPLTSETRAVDLTEDNYIRRNVPVVCEQLQKAGVRLAMMLNESFRRP